MTGQELIKPANPTLEATLVENQKLKEEVFAMNRLVKELQSQLGAAGITDDIRDEVRQRMAAGLSQEQAIEVTRKQHQHDADLAREAAKGKS